MSPNAAVVFLHPVGLNAAGATWIDVPGIEGRSLLGHGGRVAVASVTMAEFADDIAAGLAGPTHLVGCSLGAMVAMHLVVRRPELVASLFLACGSARPPDRTVLRKRADEFDQNGPAGMLSSTISRWFTPEYLSGEDPLGAVRYATDALLSTPRVTSAATWCAIAEHDVLDRIAGIRVPVTVLAATDDKATSPAAMRAINEAVSGSRYVEIAGPHMAFLENPRDFSSRVREHLQKTR
ncbi:hypothetical protein AU252_01060 [Pseudarthrobacter sulfonivorans]|uniref:AB hydrolase-1 domain-containing protein n=1 Tax=Pseudarthrobacter sulfonivorans TaxID=121292 RepID=A0A0U3P6V5_9MICC|nr:alpha/beta fold hydrolase [Pseudarthrobacter sulfonivorans]ALV39923.1 hypothetical protein AU252_01060 [Pseudarthrobacter sulfonivorans]